MQNIIIRSETPADYRIVENLTREAFWNVYRPGCLEHYVLHTFRTDTAFVPELDLVMERSGEIIGHVMYVRSAIQTDDGREVPIMTFGPISIAPAWQRQGIWEETSGLFHGEGPGNGGRRSGHHWQHRLLW